MSIHNSPSPRPRTGIQDVVYLTYAVDCTERNAEHCEKWSIRRQARIPFPDLRDKAELDRFERLAYAYLRARAWMASRRLAARRGLTRNLMEFAS